MGRQPAIRKVSDEVGLEVLDKWTDGARDGYRSHGVGGLSRDDVQRTIFDVFDLQLTQLFEPSAGPQSEHGDVTHAAVR